MHAVINTLRFKDPVDPALFERAERQLTDQMRGREGFQGFRVVQIAEDQVMLVIFADTTESFGTHGERVGQYVDESECHPFARRTPERRIGRIIATVMP
jgi:hypothetical protein